MSWVVDTILHSLDREDVCHHFVNFVQLSAQGRAMNKTEGELFKFFDSVSYSFNDNNTSNMVPNSNQEQQCRFI